MHSVGVQCLSLLDEGGGGAGDGPAHLQPDGGGCGEA